jgi:hypothetical protein
LLNPGNETTTAPHLYSVDAVNQAPRFGDSFGVVGANNRFTSDNVPVDPDEIRSVFRHGRRFLEVPAGNTKNAIRLSTFVHKLKLATAIFKLGH